MQNLGLGWQYVCFNISGLECLNMQRNSAVLKEILCIYMYLFLLCNGHMYLVIFLLFRYCLLIDGCKYAAF